ncbi:MAG: glycosyl hydrolase family 79 C-terminal domain-containing protein [Mucilaginibacter sp.]
MKKTWVLIFLYCCLVGCKKENTRSNSPPVNGYVVNVNIDQDQLGYKIPDAFEGLSFETRILAENPDFLNENNQTVIQLIKNLGPGILRIGGNSSDEISWTGGPRSGNTPANSLTTSDIDRLSAFSKATGWPVLFGLNLGNNNATLAADEALYAQNSLGSNLYALQAGNEPDIYNSHGMRSPAYNYSAYQNEWNSYFTAIRALSPQAVFAGPDVSYNSVWISSFAENEHGNISLLDGHHYNTGPASSPSITYKTILAPNLGLPQYLLTLQNASETYNLPYRISECNSVYGGGKTGVSDVFASALWALDLMWQVAENKGQGVNFHCGDQLVYSPIIIKNGVVTAQPEYYAMLAFKYGNKGETIIPASIAGYEYNCSAYACANADNTYSITLINKDDTKDLSFNINLTKSISTIRVARLKAPGITAIGGVTFSGSSVQTDGTFTPGAVEQYTVNQKNFNVNVPAGSAAIITLQ